MEAHDEIPEPVLAATAESPVDAIGCQHGDLARAHSAGARLVAPIQRGRRVRRWLLWGLSALSLGTAAYGFAFVNRPKNCYLRALTALGRDDFDSARYELPRLQGLPEFEPHASLINGILLLQVQKPDDALEEFRLAIDHPDTRVLALTLAGRTLLQKRQFSDAERALRKALEYDPNLAEAHRCLGAAYYDIGDLRRSLMHLEKATELSQRDPRPYQFMADIHRTFRQDELAIEDLRELLLRGAVGSMRQEALLDMARLQSQLLRHQEAINTLNDVDESPDSLAILANCHYALENLDAARESIIRALALDPDHFDALLAQGRLSMQAKDFTAAVESLDRALQLRPRNQALHALLSEVMHAQGRDDLAKQHAETASQLRDLDQEYHELLSNAAVAPRDALTCYRLGLMAERLGMENEASVWYRAVLLIDPRHASARERLSELPGALANLGERQ